ncbi:TetR/AcrR family transcriptional regulator [Glycomyces sp. A-F 0318]|uniref:TetR/AcrR family transcriptional regulator n=1 Tax=Glycomyces amatae TaxID=2881355 RepID=UPI001E3B52D0|nr:TetR/AcrR family transcriptional regulator [Glycomyces amatae]MCD0445466.1 TetR/AcrR family transcriptional regulator [Glycomyces amatae]
MGTPSGRRAYDSLRRTDQAQRTKAEIAQAARRLFTANGWAATTIREVAEEAGVAVPTVYAAYKNKTGLALALADAADLTADLPAELAGLEAAHDDPAGQLAAMAAYDRRLFERAGDLIAMVREAGRTEPELAAVYRAGRRRADAFRTEVFAAWPKGTLKTEVGEAVDVYAALCSIDTYTTLTEERSWSPDRIEAWWAGLLPRELLGP